MGGIEAVTLASCLPLPGGPAGDPVFTSNNPETFTGLGALLGTAAADPARGGGTLALAGDFGAYLHHSNGTGGLAVVQLLVTNPGADDLTVSGAGSGWTNGELPLGRGTGPDYAVAADLLDGTWRAAVGPTVVAPLHAATVWSATLLPGQYVDARLALTTTGGAYVYAVAAPSADPNDAVALTRTAAPGNIAPPGDPPPPYGREAGVYAADAWEAAWDVAVPAGGHVLGYAVDTALGTGFVQDQAFPALLALSDSSLESVGDYGDVFDLTIGLDATPGGADRVEVWLVSLGGGSPSFWLNGPVEVDGAAAPIWLAPGEAQARLAEVAVPGSVHVRLPIPGLASIPFALALVAP